MTDLIEAAEALERALHEYVNSGFTGLAFHLVTIRREELRRAVEAAKRA